MCYLSDELHDVIAERVLVIYKQSPHTGKVTLSHREKDLMEKFADIRQDWSAKDLCKEKALILLKLLLQLHVGLVI